MFNNLLQGGTIVNYDNFKNKTKIENQFLIVRKDIINPESYFIAENYSYYSILKFIYDCGGYCFFVQFYKFFTNRNSAYNAIEKLKQHKFIGSEFLNNNKYIYLKYTAIKYVQHRGDEFYNEMLVLKDRSHFLNKPSDSILKKSIGIFDYNYNYYDNLINFNEKIFDVYLSKTMATYFIKKLDSVLKFDFDLIEKEFYYLYDRSNVLLASIMNGDNYIDENLVVNNLSDVTFHFVILDYNNLTKNKIINSAINIHKILCLINSSNVFNTTIKNTVFNFVIEVCTFSQTEKIRFEDKYKSLLSSIFKKNKYIIDSMNNSKLIKHKDAEDLRVKRENNKAQYISGFKKVIFTDKLEMSYNCILQSSQKVKTFLKRKDVDRFNELNKYLNEEEEG